MAMSDERYRLLGEALRSCYEITSGIASLTATVGLLCESANDSDDDYELTLNLCSALALFAPRMSGDNDAMWNLLNDCCPDDLAARDE